MIEAVMLVVLGFLSASLLALAVLPALARRADRLARRRAEATFPLSLAEIAADRDHLRAALALQARTVEQQAERSFAAKAVAMKQLGGRDMTIARMERDIAAREETIAGLKGELAATQATLSTTRESLAAETAQRIETAAALDRRIADVAALETTLAETRSALGGTSDDLAVRSRELDEERATLGRIEALLADREAELARLRGESDAMRVKLVENRTAILVLEGKRDDLVARLALRDQALKEANFAQGTLTQERDEARAALSVLEARFAAASETAAHAADLQAEVGRLGAALEEARAAPTPLRKGRRSADDAALRQEISRLAERLMTLEPKQEAAE